MIKNWELSHYLEKKTHYYIMIVIIIIIIDTMKYSPWEADNSSIYQWIPRFVCNPTDHYCVHNTPHPLPTTTPSTIA